MPFLSSWTICFKMHTLFFKKDVGSYEIEHKTCYFFFISGAVPPYNARLWG